MINGQRTDPDDVAQEAATAVLVPFDRRMRRGNAVEFHTGRRHRFAGIDFHQPVVYRDACRIDDPFRNRASNISLSLGNRAGGEGETSVMPPATPSEIAHQPLKRELAIRPGEKQLGMRICRQKRTQRFGVEMIGMIVAAGDKVDRGQPFRRDRRAR